MKLTICTLATLLTLALPGTSVHADQFVNGQSADVVLGQPDFTSFSVVNRPERHNGSHGISRDPATGKVFVALFNQHRILRYSNDCREIPF